MQGMTEEHYVKLCAFAEIFQMIEKGELCGSERQRMLLNMDIGLTEILNVYESNLASWKLYAGVNRLLVQDLQKYLGVAWSMAYTGKMADHEGIDYNEEAAIKLTELGYRMIEIGNTDDGAPLYRAVSYDGVVPDRAKNG